MVIQAITLASTGQPALLEAAIVLADRAVRDHQHPAMLAGAHLAKAGALADLGRHAEAIEAYRAAVAAQRAYPGVRHHTHLDFGDLVVALNRTDLYREVEGLFEDFGDSDRLFPASEFRHFRLRAVFALARGSRDEARDCAQTALVAARKTSTEFRYHKRLALFRGAPPDVLDELQRLAAV